jgi:tetratricopeptide (TPR) repeat protein
MDFSPETPMPAHKPVARGEILQQLDRILAHPLFNKSHRLSSFLRYAVETTLAGDADSLKEFVIGAEVFKLGDSFDPQVDNIVRVNANRLRGKLAEYYQHRGQSDSVVIDLPRGGYIPVFSSSAPINQNAPRACSDAAVVRTSVGRQPELDRIRAAFASACQGTGLMVTVSGDAGMGKTTIVEDFVSEVESGGRAAWIARGRGSERLAKTDAFVPIFESLDELTRGESGVQAAQVMKTAAPGWLSQLAPARDDLAGSRPEVSAERMRREFVRFFEALSVLRPVILFLDDLHWADASTCDLLFYLGSRMRDIRILIVATYRPSELFGMHPFLPVRLALEQKGASQDIQLEFLTRGDIECYLNRRFPDNRFPTELVSVVHERTEGNPLFMRDMMNFLVDKRILIDRAGHWQLDRDIAEIRNVIPAGTESMIRLHIEQFSEADRRLLQCAAVQGVEFDSAVISLALSMDPGEVEERLQTLDRVHRFTYLVEEREFPDRTFSVRYRFVHVFYQNALYAGLGPTRRAALCLAVAQSMVTLAGDTGPAVSAEVALLFESGRDSDRAAHYFLHAARHAVSVFAYPEGAILCVRGLDSLLSIPESRERDARELEFSLILGMAQMATHGYAAPEVESIHRRSRELCLRLNEKRRLVQVLWGLHTCLINAGELIAALKLAREMRQLADALADPASITESLHALGTTLAFMGDLVVAREALERFFTLSPVGQHRFCGSLYVLDPCVTSLSMLARVLARMGFLDEAVEKAATSVALAEELAHPPSVAYATFWIGWLCHARGEHTKACTHLEAAMALSRTHGLPQILEWGRVVRGSSLAHLGRIEEGITEIRISLDNQLAMRCLLERPYCLTLLAEALLLVKGYREALELCDEALQIASNTEGRSYDVQTNQIRKAALLALNLEVPTPSR